MLKQQCQFESLPSDPLVKVCTQCGNALRTNTPPDQLVAECPKAAHLYPPTQTLLTTVPLPTIGPGTELKLLLRKFRITPQPGCKCNQRAAVMDLEGCDWCLEHVEEICDWMQEEAERRGLPFLRTAGRVMVKMAVKRARKKLAMLEQPS